MLLSAVLRLRSARDVELVPSLGRAAHALFLALVREADPALAAELHGDGSIKPFTAGFLEDGVLAGGRRTVCRVDESYHVRFTTLREDLTRLLLDRVLPKLPEVVGLDGAEFRVQEVATRAAEHSWAGRASYEALASAHLLSPVTPPVRVELGFHAPATFRSQGRHVPLPLPELVFGSPLERWNAFAPVRLQEGLRSYAAEALAVSRYRLATRLVELGGGKQVGFVGECQYTALRPDQEALRQLHLLATFAFYGGVGHKTAMGLGRARQCAREGRRG